MELSISAGFCWVLSSCVKGDGEVSHRAAIVIVLKIKKFGNL